MRIELNEQEMIDAVCVYVADRFHTDAGGVRAELLYDEASGIVAETSFAGQSQRLLEQDVIDSTAAFLAEFHRFDPSRMSVVLGFEEDRGVYAEADVR